MEACVLVEREQEKIMKKLKSLSGSASKKLQQLIDQVADLKAKFEAGQCGEFQLAPSRIPKV